MNVVLRFRAYPDTDTASEAWRHIDIHRQIRNHAVRDYNAARNVLNRGLEQVGAGRSDSTPVETALPASTDGGHSTVSVDAKRVVETGSPVSPDTG